MHHMIYHLCKAGWASTHFQAYIKTFPHIQFLLNNGQVFGSDVHHTCST